MINDKIESIKVLGSGCPTCKKLHETVKQIASEMGIGVAVEYSDDIQELVATGAMSSPVLVVNGQVVSAGQSLGPEKARELLAGQPAIESESCHCSGGCC